jgi:hypothetical protein
MSLARLIHVKRRASLREACYFNFLTVGSSDLGDGCGLALIILHPVLKYTYVSKSTLQLLLTTAEAIHLGFRIVGFSIFLSVDQYFFCISMSIYIH